MSAENKNYPRDYDAERKYLNEAIADITHRLKGHLDNIERALLVADRRDFRERLLRMDGTK